MKQIENWTQACQMQVTWSEPRGEIPALATLSVEGQPLSLHFSMTAEQAREMARTLASYADEVDTANAAKLAAA